MRVSIQACHCEERSACTVPQAHVCDSIPFGNEAISPMPDLLVGTGDCFAKIARNDIGSHFFSMAEQLRMRIKNLTQSLFWI
ncbi:MAG: hypothetical protein Fur0043_10140 [Anaerolineales bacterium]